MSKEYDEYLRDHITYVQVGFSWIEKNLPDILPIGENFSNFIIHDDSKTSVAEYNAYDQYFYGGNKEDKDVKDAFDIAWLHHIHENPHHWQHWVLLEDEGGASKPKALPIPYRYILEMICDWWAFSWKSGNLYEIFDWYKDHEGKMLLEAGTKKKVDDILDKIRWKLVELDKNDGELMHYGTKGMHWGERNGPPYPIGSNLKNKTPAHVEEIKDYKGKLYFISEKGVEGSKLSPRVPKNFFTENGYEDNQTPRICFAPSVDQCLMGLSQNLKEKEFIVYEPEEYPETVYKPNKGAVPDSEVTGELWVKDPVSLKEVGKIFVSADDGKDGKKFEYGEDKEAELYGWNYEWKKK